MAFKCTNVYCPYGDGYENNNTPTIYADGTRPEYTRSDSYSQRPLREENEQRPWNGLCLNCIDDEEKERRECY